MLSLLGGGGGVCQCLAPCIYIYIVENCVRTNEKIGKIRGDIRRMTPMVQIKIRIML